MFEVSPVSDATFPSLFQAHFVLDIEASNSKMLDANIRDAWLSKIVILIFLNREGHLERLRVVLQSRSV